MASDHLHDNCVSKHGDAKYTLLFVGLGPNAIVKTRKKMIWRQPKKSNKGCQKKHTCSRRLYGDFCKPMIIAWNKSTKHMTESETISGEKLKDESGDKIPPLIPITLRIFLLWK